MPGYINGTVKERGPAALASPRLFGAPACELPDSDLSGAMRPLLPMSQSSDSEYVGKAIEPSEYEPSETVMDDFATDEVDPRPVNGNLGVSERPNLCRRWVPPSRSGSPQTSAPMASNSDQNFAGFIPHRGADLVVTVPRNYALAFVFFVFLMIIWYLLMNRGNYYYIRLEIGS